MPVAKTVLYTADDGKTYPTYEAAQTAQNKFRRGEIARVAFRKQLDSLQALFGAMSSNATLNSNLAMEIVNKPELAVKLRDHMNRVVDYHRRKKKA